MCACVRACVCGGGGRGGEGLCVFRKLQLILEHRAPAGPGPLPTTNLRQRFRGEDVPGISNLAGLFPRTRPKNAEMAVVEAQSLRHNEKL